MSNSFSILGVMPTVPVAVSGDLPTFTSNGIIGESGYSIAAGSLTSSVITVPTSGAVLAAIGGAITSSKSFRGGYDASSNLFPSTGGSGSAGAVVAGDVWNITVNGTLGGQSAVVGNTILALVSTPGQTSANWLISNTLTNVVITNPLTMQYVRYDGSSWVNSSIQAVDLPLATSSLQGVISTVAQSFAGSKSFVNATNQISLGSTSNTTTFNSPTSLTAIRVVTFPDSDSNTIRPLDGATTSNWVQYVSADGTQHLLQPTYTDLSGSVPVWNQNTTGTAANVASGIANQLLYQSAANVTAKLSVNSTATVQALTQVSSGSPTWTTLSTANLGDVSSGTWVILDQSSDGVTITSNATPTYWKVGKTITCTADITIGANSGPSNLKLNLPLPQLSGLSFEAATTSSYTLATNILTGTSGTFNIVSSAGIVYLTNSNLSNRRIIFTLIYIAA